MRTSGRLLVPATFLASLLLGYYLGTYQFSLLRMGAEFGLTGAQFGLLAGMTFASMTFLPVVFGILSDKYGKKPMLIIALSILLLALLLFIPVQSFGGLLAAAFLAGSGFGCAEALYIGALSDTNPAGRVTSFANLSQSLFSAGAFLAPLISSAALSAGFGWRQLFLPPIALTVATILLYAFSQIAKRPPLREDATGAVMPRLLRSPLLYLLLAWMLLYVGLESSTASYSDSFVTLWLGAPDSAALALSLFWVMMIPSRLLAGFIKKHHLRFMVICTVLLIAASCAIALIQNATVALVCFALAGFFCGPIWPTIFACGQRAFPHKTGTIGSLCVAAGGLGGFLLPVLCGVVSESVSLPAVFFTIAAGALVMLLLTLVAGRALKRQGVDLG